MSRSPRTTAARRAREKALENARAFSEREAQLFTIAEEFFTLQEGTTAAQLENEIAAKEKELEALRAKRKEAREEARRVLSAPVAAMAALNEPTANIAQRLGLTRAEVKGLLSVHKESAETEE